MLTHTSKHAASLTDGEVVEESDLGSITRLTADNFPILHPCTTSRTSAPMRPSSSSRSAANGRRTSGWARLSGP